MRKPVYLKAERKFNQPLDKVWEVVAVNFGNVSAYNPAIKSSRFEGEIRSGVGTKRHCDFQQSGWIKEEITDWKDKDYFELEFIQSSLPMRYLRSKFYFEELGEQTKLTQEFWYRMKAPMGWLSGLMRSKMKKTLENGLNGLEIYLNN